MQVKKCISCNKSKLINDFYVRRNKCKKCHCKDVYRQRMIKENNFSIAQYLYTSTRKIADVKKDFEFNLTIEDINNILIKQDNRCYWTNIELDLNVNKFRKPLVDRLDNNQGYTIDNIVITIWAINRMRGNLDADEFKKLIDEIVTSKKNELLYQ